MKTKYYNKSYDCTLEFLDKKHILFSHSSTHVHLLLNAYMGTNIVSIEQLDHNKEFIIEGIMIPEQNSISFTGLLDNHGLVDIDFDRVNFTEVA
jgi:hypothetical protein